VIRSSDDRGKKNVNRYVLKVGSNTELPPVVTESDYGSNTELHETVNETVTIKQKDNHKESAPKKAKNSGGENDVKRESRVVFVKPRVEEIQAYAFERNYTTLDAERFYDYYESNGWMVGSHKMKDWKATVRNWQRSKQQGGSNATPKVKKEFHHDYELSDEFLKKHNMDCIDSVAVPIHSGFIEG
jgi:hypothetical protein